MKFEKFTLGLTLLMLSATTAAADCAFKNEIPIKAITSAFPAYKAIADNMQECGNVQVELDQEVRTKSAPALAANPALYHISSVHNGTIVPLLNQDTIRPLDDLVAKYGQGLNPNQLIKIDGKIMAIAFMVNMQHLMYRKDIFADLGIEVPTDYEQVLAAAKKIKEAGVVDYPLGATWMADWNIGIDFDNLFVGYGGEFVNDDNTPAVNSEAGRKTLEMMRKLSEYMNPEYLVADATYVQQQFQQKKIAFSNFWASRAAKMDDPAESQVIGLIGTASAPAAVPGGIPAVMFSWDGIAIAKNITDEEAEAAFRVALEGGDTEMVKENNDLAVWLIDGYQPTEMAKGAIETIQNGAKPNPSTVWRGLINDAIEKNVVEFMTGKKTVDQTLTDIEAAYTTSAKEAGLL
ncbi:carbohydrate ABC transporter substrate-binding protein (CUT1 family) [Hoeflea marina]|uniref:Carbohydrate ABC transporter substrate-binding protein (CUT1 family) n=1 Tax=Hoeflea marina TaxID=274592 RepID=A0A317PSY4_9HYPH|nr:extracellular solute-binding protein [Hoeflea marina]PWW01934.1 carbohydrate ABC transporter substrate-binding protein (CUT1 family) [Hoeflea marina]